MNLQNEKDLVLKARDNPEYFGELYDLHFDRILNYTFRRVGDFDLANDITAEVFLKAYINLWKFRWKEIPFSAWLYRVATNEINQFFRRKAYRAECTEDLNLKGILNSDRSQYENDKQEAEKKLKENEDFDKTIQILKTLPISYQEVISLKYFEGKLIKEICIILNKKEGTIKSLLSRGLEKIRQAW